MFDADAVVWELMHEAIAGDNYYLRRGIENMRKAVWLRWLEVYEPCGK
jgi:hypothetical protein